MSVEARATIHRNAYPGSEPPFAVARCLCSAPRRAKGKRARDLAQSEQGATLPARRRTPAHSPGAVASPPRDVDRLRAHAAERVAAWIAYDSSPVGTGLAARASTKPLGETFFAAHIVGVADERASRARLFVSPICVRCSNI